MCCQLFGGMYTASKKSRYNIMLSTYSVSYMISAFVFLQQGPVYNTIISLIMSALDCATTLSVNSALRTFGHASIGRLLAIGITQIAT